VERKDRMDRNQQEFSSLEFMLTDEPKVLRPYGICHQKTGNINCKRLYSNHSILFKALEMICSTLTCIIIRESSVSSRQF